MTVAEHPPDAPPVASSLVVVGASAGGVEPLVELVRGLPADFPGCVLVVLHVPATGTSALPAILDRAGPLPARHAAEGDRLTAGQVLVARPDHHLLVLGESVALTQGPTENGHRPAVDVLFRSAARAWRDRVISVVLSGALDDGAAGSLAVRSQGGRCLVQDPEGALHPAMPSAAAAVVPDAEPVVVSVLAERLAVLAREHQSGPTGLRATGPDVPVAPWMDTENLMADLDPSALHTHDRPGDPSGFGCPDCGGSLFTIDDGADLRRFRCRVGHAWSPESLLERQGAALEGALWMALRSLEEKAALQAQLQDRAVERGSQRSAERFGRGREEAVRAAEMIRRMVLEVGAGHPGEEPGAPTFEPDPGPTPAASGESVS